MKIAIITLEDRIELIKDWFLNSGIQSSEGGFYAWQDMKDKSHPYLYSEITGYAITLMCFLYAVTKEDRLIKNACRAAQWIMADALDPLGGVLTRKYLKNAVEHYSFERGNIYSFDSGMAAFGILKLYGITGDREYLECADKVVNFLNNKMIKANGLYYPVFDAKDGKPCEEAVKWSTQSGSFHCKLALCLCELAVIKKEASYNALAKKLIDSSIEHFRKVRFITDTSGGTSHLHPYSYTLEGMLYYSHRTKDDAYKDAVEEAFDWMAGLQCRDGGFPTQVFGNGRHDIAHQRSDIQSQILRLSYFIKSKLDRGRLIERLLEFQNTAEDFKGGFLYGVDQDGVRQDHINSWCSMFALQTLYLVCGKANNDIVMDYLV